MASPTVSLTTWLVAANGVRARRARTSNVSNGREGVGVAGDVDGGGDDGVEVGRRDQHRGDVGHAEDPGDPLEGVGLGFGDLDPAADEPDPAGRVAQRPLQVVAQGPFEPGAVAALEPDLVVVGQEEVGVHAACGAPAPSSDLEEDLVGGQDPHPPAAPVVEQSAPRAGSRAATASSTTTMSKPGSRASIPSTA